MDLWVKLDKFWKKWFCFKRLYLPFQKVRHLPHLPPLHYGHVMAVVLYDSCIYIYICSPCVTGPSLSWLYGSLIYNYLCNQCPSPFRRGVLDTTLCDKVCQWLVADQWFSLGTSVSSSNKTDHNDIAEILLKVALNTITPKPLKLWVWFQPSRDEMYLSQLNVVKFDHWVITGQKINKNVDGFLLVLWFSSPIRLTSNI